MADNENERVDMMRCPVCGIEVPFTNLEKADSLFEAHFSLHSWKETVARFNLMSTALANGIKLTQDLSSYVPLLAAAIEQWRQMAGAAVVGDAPVNVTDTPRSGEGHVHWPTPKALAHAHALPYDHWAAECVCGVTVMPDSTTGLWKQVDINDPSTWTDMSAAARRRQREQELMSTIEEEPQPIESDVL